MKGAAIIPLEYLTLSLLRIHHGLIVENDVVSREARVDLVDTLDGCLG